MKLDVDRRAREQVVEELRTGREVPADDPREPGRRRARLARRDERDPQPARQGHRHVHVGEEEFPLPYEYRDLPLEDRQPRAPAGRRGRARSCSSTAATSTGCRSASSGATTRTSSTSTTTTTTPGSAPRTWSSGARPAPRRSSTSLIDDLGVELTPRDRGGAVRRRSSPTPASSSTRTRRRGPPHGRRADRARGRRPRGVPPALRERAASQSCSCWRACSRASSASTTAG